MDALLSMGFLAVIALAESMGAALGGLWTWRLLRRRAVNPVLAMILAIVAGMIAFGGPWMVLDVVWLARSFHRLWGRAFRRRRPAT